MLKKLVLTLISLSIANTAFASEQCKLLEKELDTENTLHYKTMVQQSIKKKINEKTIDITQVLSESEWVAISASTEISEPGVLFFKNNKFVDVWGGNVDPEDKPDVIKWAKNIHVPNKLSECFYESIVLD